MEMRLESAVNNENGILRDSVVLNEQKVRETSGRAHQIKSFV